MIMSLFRFALLLVAIASSRLRNCITSGASASHTSNGIVSSQASINSGGIVTSSK
jgi:hypothetical protein